MRRFLAALLVVCGLTTWLGTAIAYWQSVPQNAIVTAGGCSQATNFLARTTAYTHNTAATTLICDGVTHGWFTVLDGMSIFAANSTTNANLNWVSASFGFTCSNAPTFTADQGYTGNAFNTFCDSAYNPTTNATNYAQNSAMHAFCVTNSRNTPAPYAEFGAQTTGGSNAVAILPFAFTTLTAYNINDSNFNAPSVTANAQGLWIAARTGSSTIQIDKNGTNLINDGSNTSSGVPNATFFALGTNDGTGVLGANTGDSIAFVAWGGAMNSTVRGSMYTDLHTFFTAIGTTGC